jgi:hypothetical protein
MPEPVKCLHCREEVIRGPDGGMGWVHVFAERGNRWITGEQCRPTYAAPDFSVQWAEQYEKRRAEQLASGGPDA